MATKRSKRGVWRRTDLASYKAGEPAWETVLSIDALNEAEGESWVYKGHMLLDEGGDVPPTRTLFPGESCYPLSSTSNEEEVDAELFNEELQAETHQLNKIFDHIGVTPNQQPTRVRDILAIR